jgi:chloramphenicol 3-O phosphotransferase
VGRPGRVVVLNGTASAGKTSLAAAIQRLDTRRWVVLGQDSFAQSLVPRWVSVDGEVEHGSDGFRFVRDESGLHVEAGPVGQRLLRGYRYAVGACARAGNDVLVDECKFDAGGWDEWARALDGIPTTWVKVECDLAECERRERARADRRLLVGLARGHGERAHRDAQYDLVVDLTDGALDGAARAVLAGIDAAR